MYDKIEFAITCNENISDAELNYYILSSQGKLMLTLNKAQEQMNSVGMFGQSEIQEYRDEIVFMVQRIAEHPTMAQFSDNVGEGLMLSKETPTGGLD